MKLMSSFFRDFLNKHWLDGCGDVPIELTALLFIDTPPTICYIRICKDGTHTNADHCCYPFDFLDMLHSCHENMFELLAFLMKRVVVEEYMTLADVALIVVNFIHGEMGNENRA